MQPRSITQIIDRKRYSTEKATLVSGNDYWDGHNWERSGRNTFLYKTPNGAYFAAHLTCWQGEADVLEPLTEGEAVAMWEAHDRAGDVRVPFAEAFPSVQVTEA